MKDWKNGGLGFGSRLRAVPEEPANLKLDVSHFYAAALRRPIVATPGIPPDRVKNLREAFAKTPSDPAVIDAVNKKMLELDPTRGEELESLPRKCSRPVRRLSKG